MENIIYILIAVGLIIYVVNKLRETPAQKELKRKKWIERMEENERRAKEIGLPIKMHKTNSSNTNRKIFEISNPIKPSKSHRCCKPIDCECEICHYDDCDCH